MIQKGGRCQWRRFYELQQVMRAVGFCRLTVMDLKVYYTAVAPVTFSKERLGTVL